jgi:hypothetical protein
MEEINSFGRERVLHLFPSTFEIPYHVIKSQIPSAQPPKYIEPIQIKNEPFKQLGLNTRQLRDYNSKRF